MDYSELRTDIKELRKDVGEIKITLATNTAHLGVHMQRTTANEIRIASLEKWLLGLLGSILVALVANVWHWWK